MLRHKWLLIGVLGTFALFPLVQAAEENSNAGGNGAAAPAGGNGGARERGNRRGGRGAGGGGNFDPSQYRERMMGAMKEQLGATDDEWKTLQPKIEKVSTIQRELRPPMGGFGGRGRPDADGPESAVGKAQGELRTALQDKSTSADDIAKKLAALREARAKAKEDLAAAQKDLKASVNARQEATLVSAGMLD